MGMPKERALITPLLLGCLLGLANAQELIQYKVEPDTVISFGSVEQTAIVEKNFTVSNLGDQTLNIQFMEFDTAGMTAAVKPAIKPGQSMGLVMYLDTSPHTGLVEGSAVISFENPGVPPLKLTLTGWVSPKSD